MRQVHSYHVRHAHAALCTSVCAHTLCDILQEHRCCQVLCTMTDHLRQVA